MYFFLIYDFVKIYIKNLLKYVIYKILFIYTTFNTIFEDVNIDNRI
jgi:hypothetical protein